MRMLVFLLLLIAALPTLGFTSWDFSRHAIPLNEIKAGGPPRDGIPALFSPDYVAASKADYMRGDERVLGVFHKGVARAYPLRVLSWHELVNDSFGGDPLLVSW
jgi:hypothetical protein